MSIEGTGLPLPGNNIDTDRIIPARFLKSVSFEGLETHLFEDDRLQVEAQGGTHPIADARFTGASIAIVNVNFGCGSSREHAPQAIRRRGIRAVIGRVFFRDLLWEFGRARPSVRLSRCRDDSRLFSAWRRPIRRRGLRSISLVSVSMPSVRAGRADARQRS